MNSDQKLITRSVCTAFTGHHRKHLHSWMWKEFQ